MRSRKVVALVSKRSRDRVPEILAKPNRSCQGSQVEICCQDNTAVLVIDLRSELYGILI